MVNEIKDFHLLMQPAEAREYIQDQTDHFGVFLDLDRIYEVIALRELEMNQYRKMAIAHTRDPLCAINDKNYVIDKLTSMGVAQQTFMQRKGARVSYGLSAPTEEAILQNPIVNEDAKVFLKIYQKYKNANNMVNKLFKMIEYDECTDLSSNGHRMLMVHPEWNLLSTSRIQASNPNVQQIDRNLSDLIVAPKGYTLWRADSAQIEPCINFSTFLRDELIVRLILAYNDAYFGLWRYCALDKQEEMLLRQDFDTNYKHIEINDELKENRQQLKRLTNAGSYGSSNLGNINPDLAASYEQKIVKHPKRIAFEAQVVEAVQHGESTFYGLFGTPVVPEETPKYKRGEPGWMDHLVRCGINNPVQTTASELMTFSVHQAREILNRHPKSHICYYKHDEACFYLHDDDVSDGIMDELEGITAYNVKGWIPIKADSFVGVKPPTYETYL